MCGEQLFVIMHLGLQWGCERFCQASINCYGSEQFSLWLAVGNSVKRSQRWSQWKTSIKHVSYLPNTSIVDMFSITTIAKTLNIRVKLDAAANCTLPFKSLSVFIFELAYTFSAKPLLLGFDGFIFILTNLSTFPHTFTLQLWFQPPGGSIWKWIAHTDYIGRTGGCAHYLS